MSSDVGIQDPRNGFVIFFFTRSLSDMACTIYQHSLGQNAGQGNFSAENSFGGSNVLQ
jgi:hypothetical protein